MSFVDDIFKALEVPEHLAEDIAGVVGTAAHGELLADIVKTIVAVKQDIQTLRTTARGLGSPAPDETPQ